MAGFVLGYILKMTFKKGSMLAHVLRGKRFDAAKRATVSQRIALHTIVSQQGPSFILSNFLWKCLALCQESPA